MWLNPILFGFTVAATCTTLPTLGPMISSRLWKKYECKIEEARFGSVRFLDSDRFGRLKLKYSFVASHGTNIGTRVHVLREEVIDFREQIERFAQELKARPVVYCYANPWRPTSSALSREFDLYQIKSEIEWTWRNHMPEIVIAGLGAVIMAAGVQWKWRVAQPEGNRNQVRCSPAGERPRGGGAR